MKQIFTLLGILFIFASCQKNDDNFYVQEIMRLEEQVMQAEYERDMFKSKLEKYEPSDYMMLPDTSAEMSMNSIKAFVRFYPN